MPLSRPPGPRLQPFISQLWANEGRRQGHQSEQRELMLPSGDTHVVIRLGHSAVQILENPQDRFGETISTAVVGGARVSAYAKLVGEQAPTVGFILRPGAAYRLMGAPGHELAGRHTSLDDIIPASLVADLRDKLLSLQQPSARLWTLERFFEDQVADCPGPDAVITAIASRLRRGAAIGTIVAEIGYSHRHLAASFAAQTGLTPKLYQRIHRFSCMIDEWQRMAGGTLADLAVQFGYADQAHLTRDFRTFAGVTPHEYRRRLPLHARHVPIAP